MASLVTCGCVKASAETTGLTVVQSQIYKTGKEMIIMNEMF